MILHFDHNFHDGLIILDFDPFFTPLSIDFRNVNNVHKFQIQHVPNLCALNELNKKYIVWQVLKIRVLEQSLAKYNQIHR